MDRKSILILASCFVLLMLWQLLAYKIWPPPPHLATATNLVSRGTSVPETPAGNSTAPIPAAVNPPAAISSSESEFVVHSDIPEEILVASNDNALYTFTSRGGGIKNVELLHYPETISSHRLKKQPTNDLATLNATNVPPVFALVGDDALQGDGYFKLSRTAEGVRAEKKLTNGLNIVKDFQLGTNYLLNISVRLENQSQKPLALPAQLWSAGTATPMNPQDRGFAQAVMWYNGSKAATVNVSYFDTNTSRFFGLWPRTPQTAYTGGSNDVYWTSAQNQFFTLATIPKTPALFLGVHMVDLPPASPEEIEANPSTIRNQRGLQAALMYPARRLEPGGSVTNEFILFAGPKEYQTLARLAARFNNDIDLVMSFGFFGPISKALLVTMNWLHNSLTLAYGWIIILITVVIKGLFWPLTQASTRSAKRMQALQPQLKALQEKYKDDPQKLTSKQWEFYKKNNVNPLSGCLPMLLQVPVFIGFYGMLRSAIELRGASFWWMGDMSKPDTIFSLPIPLHFFGMPDIFFPVNPMPLIMGVSVFWQASMTPPSPGMDPGQQKMMKYMPLMMLFFMYMQPSGLALYWTVSNLLTILQTKLTRMQPSGTTPPSGPASEPARVPAAALSQKKKK